MCRRFVPLTGGIVLLCAASLCAQEAAWEQTYGSGVHAYFSQNYQGAFDLLNGVVDAGSRDPRCYYYRGLCYLHLGREEEAKLDFEKGAELETLDVNRFFNVPRSLERVQGSQRVSLETYRAKARLVALKREQERRRARYEAIRRQETRVLQRQAEEAPATPMGLPPTPSETDAESPFGLAPIKEMAPVAEPAGAGGAEPPAAASPLAVPASSEPAPMVPSEDDPFSSAPSSEPIHDPLTTPASAELPLEKGAGRRISAAIGRALSRALTGGGDESDQPAAGAEDPFADDGPVSTPADDPFADDGPVSTPAADPFGDDMPAPADDVPVPAPANDDPFADDGPVSAPAAADPFADDTPAE